MAELRSASGRRLEGLEEQFADTQRQLALLQSGLEARVAAAEGGLQQTADWQSKLSEMAPAAALGELQRCYEAVQASAEALHGRLDRHQSAVLGQYAELQAGLTAVLVYDDSEVVGRLAAAETAQQEAAEQLAAIHTEQAEALGRLAPAAALEELRVAVEARHAAAGKQVQQVQAAVELAAGQLAALELKQAGELAAGLAAVQAAAAGQLAAVQDDASRQQAVVEEQLGGLQSRLAVAEEAQRESAVLLAGSVTDVKAAVARLAPAEALQQLRHDTEAQQGALARELAALTAASEGQHAAVATQLTAMQAGAAQAADLLKGLQEQQQQQQLVAGERQSATAEAVEALHVAAEAQQAAAAEQLGDLQARLAAANDGVALVQDAVVLVQHAVQLARQEAAEVRCPSAETACCGCHQMRRGLLTWLSSGA